MYLFRTDDESSELINLPDGMPWYLIADQGDDGNAYLYMYINGLEFPIHNSAELVEAYPGLKYFDVLGFYDAAIREIYLRLVKSASNCIDLDDVMESLLEEYLAKWQEDGIVQVK